MTGSPWRSWSRVPLVVVGGLIWFPTFASIGLSFTNWDGIGGIGTATWIGTENYEQVATIYPGFWPAVTHNLIWLAFLTFVATPFGLFLAYQLDKEHPRHPRLPEHLLPARGAVVRDHRLHLASSSTRRRKA